MKKNRKVRDLSQDEIDDLVVAQADDDTAMRLLDLYAQRDPTLAGALKQGLQLEKTSQGDDMKPQPGLNQVGAMRFAAKGAAKLMATDDGPRIAALAFDGWDTHANEGGALHDAHGNRSARLDRKPPEHELADGLDRALDVIGLPGRNAARSQHEIVARGSLADRPGETCRRVGQNSKIGCFRAEPLQHAEQQIAVGIVKTRGRQRLARLDNLIAG